MKSAEQELLNITTLQQILQLQGKQPGFLTKQITLLQDHWPQYLQDIKNELATNSFIPAADICHKIKGHTGMLGLRAVHVFAEQLETLLRSENCFKPNVELDLVELNLLYIDSIKAIGPWLRQ